jgi:RNA polymerase sigma-70 factor (ECF subfamily)
MIDLLEQQRNHMKHDHTERVAELADRHGRMVFATAYRVLGNAEDAEDALQKVFVKLLSKWNGRLKPGAVRDWGAFLRVAASRCALDMLRRKARRKRTADTLSAIGLAAEENPRHLATRREEAGLLREALSSLPKRDARVFSLRYFEDFAYAEIAEQMNVSVSQVGVILHRARKRLREILEPVVVLASPGTRSAGNAGRESGKENSHV